MRRAVVSRPIIDVPQHHEPVSPPRPNQSLADALQTRCVGKAGASIGPNDIAAHLRPDPRSRANSPGESSRRIGTVYAACVQPGRTKPGWGRQQANDGISLANQDSPDRSLYPRRLRQSAPLMGSIHRARSSLTIPASIGFCEVASAPEMLEGRGA